MKASEIHEPGYWAFCGETDMGQTEPALCRGCGGNLMPAFTPS